MFTMDEAVYTLSQNSARKSRLGNTVPTAVWSDAGNGGYCLGLSLVWAYLQLKGRDYPFDAVTKVCTFPSWQAPQVQNVYLNLQGKMDESARVAEAAEHANLQVAWERVETKSIAQVDYGDILEGYRGVFMIALSKKMANEPLKPRHAVAMSSLDGRYHFFDPEVGHFAVDDSARFQEAMRGQLATYIFRIKVDTISLYKVKKIKRGMIDRIKIWAEG